MKYLLVLLIVILGTPFVAADKLDDRDERVTRLVKAGWMITFDNRKKDRPPVRVFSTHVPTKQIHDDLAALGTIETVAISLNRQAAAQDIERLARTPKLTELRLVGGLDVDDAALEDLRHAVELKQLTVECRSATSGCLSTIGQLPKLRVLAIRFEITGDSLKLLRPARELQALDISDAKITDGRIAELKSLPNLQELVLGGPQIVDATLLPLRDFKLKILRLRYTAVTDSGLRHIEEINGLRILGIDDLGGREGYTSKLTKNGLLALVRKRPRLEIQPQHLIRQ